MLTNPRQADVHSPRCQGTYPLARGLTAVGVPGLPWLLALVMLFVLQSVLLSAHKIPQGDEVDMILSSQALFETGNTIYQRDFLGGEQSGAWHPPLRWLLVRAAMVLTPDALGASLVVNVVAALISLVTTYLLALTLGSYLEPGLARPAAVFSCFALSSMPLFQASTQIVDIDNAILPAVMIVYLAVLLSGTSHDTRRVGLLGGLLGLAFLTKLTTPLVLILLTLIWLLGSADGWRPALRAAILIVLVAFAVFAIIFAITRPLFGPPWYEAFRHNFAHFTGKAGAPWGAFARTFLELTLWTGLVSGLLFVLAGLALLKQRWQAKRGRLAVAVLAAYIIIVWCTFAYLGVTFNLRYVVPTLPALAALLGLAAAVALRGTAIGQSRGSLVSIAVAFVVVVTTAVVLLPDPLLYLKAVVKYVGWPAVGLYAAALAIVLGATAITTRLYARYCRHAWQTAIVGLAIFWLAVDINTVVKQGTGTYQVGYGYGVAHDSYAEVVAWLDANTGPTTPVVVPRDFQWLLGDRLYPVLWDEGSDGARKAGVYRRWLIERAGPDTSVAEPRALATYWQVWPRRFGGAAEALTPSVLSNGRLLHANADFLVVEKPLPTDR